MDYRSCVMQVSVAARAPSLFSTKGLAPPCLLTVVRNEMHGYEQIAVTRYLAYLYGVAAILDSRQ